MCLLWQLAAAHHEKSIQIRVGLFLGERVLSFARRNVDETFLLLQSIFFERTAMLAGAYNPLPKVLNFRYSR